MLYFLLAPITLLLSIDFFFGGYMLSCEQRGHLSYSRCPNARIAHSVYHHDLAKSFTGQDIWGHLKYDLCTDENGFKTSCVGLKNIKNFDVAFIGDSFTEGIGLSYEDSFVGKIANALPHLKVANLGVSSYSPSIYLAKVRYLLERGVTFKELVVYVDISDIQDEATFYVTQNGVVIDKKNMTQSASIEKIKRVIRWSFPLSYAGLGVLRHKLDLNAENYEPIDYLSYSYQRSAWTYDQLSMGYGQNGVAGGIESSLSAMLELSRLLKDKGISLSVGVYPWPAQLLHDRIESKQVQIWRNFCKKNCLNFHNSFDSFFELKERMPVESVVKEYFIQGDVHHNVRGAQIIADDFLKAYQR